MPILRDSPTRGLGCSNIRHSRGDSRRPTPRRLWDGVRLAPHRWRDRGRTRMERLRKTVSGEGRRKVQPNHQGGSRRFLEEVCSLGQGKQRR